MSSLQPARFENGIYQNPVPTEIGATRHFGTMLRRLLLGKEERIPRKPLGPFRTDPTIFNTPPASGLRITLLGHSSLLIEIDGTTVLIDPIYADRASMVQWFGPGRFFPPPLPMANLPPLHAVLLTHDHYDHLDAAAMQHLQERTPVFLCSMGVGAHLQRWGIPTNKIRELNWMDSVEVPSSTSTPLTLTALPARHFSGRSFKRFQTLWSSFQFKTAKHTVYHGADSGYYEGFAEIGERFGPFDLATLEIGAFDPLWHEIHLGPANALKQRTTCVRKWSCPSIGACSTSPSTTGMPHRKSSPNSPHRPTCPCGSPSRASQQSSPARPQTPCGGVATCRRTPVSCRTGLLREERSLREALTRPFTASRGPPAGRNQTQCHQDGCGCPIHAQSTWVGSLHH